MFVPRETAAVTVNIRAFLDPNASVDARQDVVKAVRHACHVYGFFNLVGHDTPQEVLREALELNKVFFVLPEESKVELRSCSLVYKPNLDRQVLMAVQFDTFLADIYGAALRIRSTEDTHRTNSPRTPLRAASRP